MTFFSQVRSEKGEEFVVTLPKKFRKNIYVIAGNYVIIEDIEEGDKVRGEIVRILIEKQVKYFHQCGKWPQQFNDCTFLTDKKYNENRIELAKARGNKLLVSSRSNIPEKDEDEDSSDSSEDDDSDLVPNFNLKAVTAFDTKDEDSSSEEDEESSSDEENSSSEEEEEEENEECEKQK